MPIPLPPPPSAARATPLDSPRARCAVRCLWASALLAAASAALLVLVAVEWGPLMSADRRVAEGLHHVAVTHPGLTRTGRVLTDWVWSPTAMRAALVAVAAWLVWRRELPLALWAAGTAVVGTALQQGLKAAVGRERPHWPDPVDSARYSAFPSGHALTAMVVCGLLVWLLVLHGARKAWVRAAAVVATVSVVGVGFTRVYLGVHWLSDVAGGTLLGAALLMGSAGAYGHGRWRQSGRR
ncbi:phosphatase PAP2 family protein [Streptomyces sp. NPDC050610]|uniref:phosphatase PAP2 family protein n=1 Tax=Streptomyces sp. NPDC050610 TaxID=3157097 RepID=UPI00341EF4B8